MSVSMFKGLATKFIFWSYSRDYLLLLIAEIKDRKDAPTSLITERAKRRIPSNHANQAPA